MRRYRVTPNARSPADSGCSLRDPCWSALRPIEASKTALRYARSTSIPIIRWPATNERSGSIWSVRRAVGERPLFGAEGTTGLDVWLPLGYRGPAMADMGSGDASRPSVSGLSAGKQDFDLYLDRTGWRFVALQLAPDLFTDGVARFGGERDVIHSSIAQTRVDGFEVRIKRWERKAASLRYRLDGAEPRYLEEGAKSLRIAKREKPGCRGRP